MKKIHDAAVCRPLEDWVSYRFGLIATRLGVIGESGYKAKHKLSTSAWRALAVLARFEPCSAAELSNHSRLDPPKVSPAIEALVERKLLRRNKDPEDQRRAVLSLTPAGRAVFNEVAADVERREAFVTSTLTPQEAEVMWRAVAKIDARIVLLAQQRRAEAQQNG